MPSRSNDPVPQIDAELRRMRDKLHERRQRLVRRDVTDDLDAPTAPDRLETVVTPRRPRASKEAPVAGEGAARGDLPAAPKPKGQPGQAAPMKAATAKPPLGNIKVPPTERLKASGPPPLPSSSAAPTRNGQVPSREAPAPEARWLEAAHRAWKSQVAELVHDRAESERCQRQLQAELDAALRAWKSQVAELLERVDEAERKAKERERWLESAHQAWKSQTAELLGRTQGVEAKPRSSAVAQDRRAAEELAALRRQAYEEQLRHVDELEGVHSAYLKRAQEVDAAHFRIVDELRREKAQALNRLGDALRLADRLNERLQQMEGIRSSSAARQKPTARRTAESPPSPAKRKGFLDQAEAAPTVIGAPPTKPPRS